MTTSPEPLGPSASFGANVETSDWIEWTGGENPVPGQMVEWRERDGDVGSALCSDDLSWLSYDAHNDIIAYRVVSPPASAAKGEELRDHIGIEWSYHDDDIHPPRPFNHVRANLGQLSTDWIKVGLQEQGVLTLAERAEGERLAIAEVERSVAALQPHPSQQAVAWRYRYPTDEAWQLTQDHDQAFKNTGEVEPLGVIPFGSEASQQAGTEDVFDREPDLGASSPEPSLRRLVTRYYRDHDMPEPERLADQYFASLTTSGVGR